MTAAADAWLIRDGWSCCSRSCDKTDSLQAIRLILGDAPACIMAKRVDHRNVSFSSGTGRGVTIICGMHSRPTIPSPNRKDALEGHLRIARHVSAGAPDAKNTESRRDG